MGQAYNCRSATDGVTNSNESQMGQLWDLQVGSLQGLNAQRRAKWGKPAIAGQQPITGLPTRMRAKWGNFGTCRLAVYKVYKLTGGPIGSLQLQVSNLRGYQLE